MEDNRSPQANAARTERLRFVIRIAMTAAALLWLASFSFYWIIPHLWILAFVIYIPGLIVFTISVIASLIMPFNRRHVVGFAPLFINLTTAAAVILTPWTELSLATDYAIKRAGMQRLAAQMQEEPPRVEVRDSCGELSPATSGEVALSKFDRLLSIDGEAHFAIVSCGTFVFFPSYYGVPDGAGGFLYAPPCTTPDKYSGAEWGAKWISIEPLGNDWYRIDGT